MWRVVVARIASLEEVDRSWSFDDLVRANLALTLQLSMENA